MTDAVATRGPPGQASGQAKAAGPGGVSPAVAAWLIAGAGAAFVAFLASMAYQPELNAGGDFGAHAFSRSPVGYAGLVRLLRADGAAVRMGWSAGAADVGPDALLVLTPRPDTPPAEIERLAKGRRALLILPKWVAVPDPRAPGKFLKAGETEGKSTAQQAGAALRQSPDEGLVTLSEDPHDSDARVVEAGGADDLHLPPAPARRLESLRTISGEPAQPLLVDPMGRAVVAIGRKRVAYVVADADLLNNRAMKDVGSAQLATRLVEGMADGGPIVFDTTLPGLGGRRNLLKLLFGPPFLPATACAVLAAALLGLMSRGRFGAVRRLGRTYAFGKRALTDSAASLLAVTGREPRLAGRYVETARAAALAATGVEPELPRLSQDEALDRIGAARGAESWTKLSNEAPVVTTRAQLMALARRAFAWRTEMTRGRG